MPGDSSFPVRTPVEIVIHDDDGHRIAKYEISASSVSFDNRGDLVVVSVSGIQLTADQQKRVGELEDIVTRQEPQGFLDALAGRKEK